MPSEPIEEFMRLLKDRDPEKHAELTERGRSTRSERMQERRAMARELQEQGYSAQHIADTLTWKDPERPVSLRTVQNYLQQRKKA